MKDEDEDDDDDDGDVLRWVDVFKFKSNETR